MTEQAAHTLSNTYTQPDVHKEHRFPPPVTPLLCRQQANLGSYHASHRSYSNTKQK